MIFLVLSGIYFFTRPILTGKIIKLAADGKVEVEKNVSNLKSQEGKKIIVLDKESFDKIEAEEENVIFIPRGKINKKTKILALLLIDENGKLTKVPLSHSFVNSNSKKLINFMD